MQVRSFVPVVLSWLLVAPLQALPLQKTYDLQAPGLSVAIGGVGLAGLGAGTRTLSVVIGGEVELALLYWTGRLHPCPLDAATHECPVSSEPFRDQILLLDGHPILGAILGTETQPATSRGPILNLGYVADVTEIVQAKGTGRQLFAVADGDRASNLPSLNGAGLLVVYTDPARPEARVLIHQGFEFAYGEDWTPGATQVVDPVSFNHGLARTDRQGEVFLFVGDSERDRPDRIDITLNNSVSDILDASSGTGWDAERIPVQVPGGTISTTVQIFSELWGRNPDSLLWPMAAMRLPTPVLKACTASYWNTHPGNWGGGVLPTQVVRNVFSQSIFYAGAGDVTLRTALRFQDGPGLLGAAKALIRAGAAALLNATDLRLEYPLSRTQVITRVDDALRRQDFAQIQALTAELEEANGGDCPLR
ncbi:MAG TPA: hypothetical protein VMW27_21520 [Thermoanaerobaculia bacterium]|nr:hypothetical protein [Thermoanaerobaculia bacterium]